MSYGQLGDAGIPNRYRVEYCPTGRGGCKGCGSPMTENTPRCGEKMRSHFFDGFEIKWFHPHCYRTSCKSVHDIVGFQKLKWTGAPALRRRLRLGLTLGLTATGGLLPALAHSHGRAWRYMANPNQAYQLVLYQQITSPNPNPNPNRMADQLVLYKQITGANADEGEVGEKSQFL